MKIKLTRNQVVNGKPAKKGATVEVKQAEARYLLARGRAIDPNAKMPESEPDPAEKASKAEKEAKKD